jgi:hypothetical protein
MQLSKILLFFFLSIAFLQSNAQRQRRRISTDEIKKPFINSTLLLNEIRSRLNETISNRVNMVKTILFTKDSVFVTTGNIKETGVWINGDIDFIITTAEGKRIKYDWMSGSENELCFQVGNNKDVVECYRKLK